MFNILKKMKEKDKKPKGFKAPPDMPKPALMIAKVKQLHKNPGK